LILYIRHGQTDCNMRKIWMGSIDSPLNEQGIIQARDIALELSKISINKIYSSPLCRAHETAMLIAEQQDIKPEIIIVPGLRERGLGGLEGTVKSEEARRKINSCPSVEAEQLFKARVKNSMSEIDKSGNVLIVSHSAVFRCLIESLGCMTIPCVQKINNCQVVELML